MPVGLFQVGDTVRLVGTSLPWAYMEKPWANGQPAGHYVQGDCVVVQGVDTKSSVARMLGQIIAIPSAPSQRYIPLDSDSQGIQGTMGVLASDCAPAASGGTITGTVIWFSADQDQKELAKAGVVVPKETCTCDFAWPNTLLGCRCGHMAWLRSQEASRGG